MSKEAIVLANEIEIWYVHHIMYTLYDVYQSQLIIYMVYSAYSIKSLCLIDHHGHHTLMAESSLRVP